MYRFDNFISLSYEFCTCVTHEDGCKTTFRKVEHIDARKDNSGFLFTFNGSSDETIDGKELEDWSEIFLKFGKALYPYTLKVSEDGKLLAVQNFEELRNSWMKKRSALVEYYEYNSHVKDVSYSYMQSLNSEKTFLSILRRNAFFHLLFWQDNKLSQEVELQDFPTPNKLSIYCFHGYGTKVGNSLLYITDNVYDEGNRLLLGGDCTITIRRDVDGLPVEVSLTANVERQNYGYFKKELKLRRL